MPNLFDDMEALNTSKPGTLAKVETPKPTTKQPQKPSEARKSKPTEAKKPANRDTTVSRHHDTDIDTVRKAVLTFGKEAATYRFTKEEKNALIQIKTTYKVEHNINTTEAEIVRIAVNAALLDFEARGVDSLIAKVLAELHGLK